MKTSGSRDTSCTTPGVVGYSFGIFEALTEARAELEGMANELESYASSHHSTTSEPFLLDSDRLCLQSYKSALSQVRERFWTTTFLSSAFWARDDTSILDANLRLMANLKKGGATSRRLFLLPRSIKKEVLRWQDERVLLCKFEDEDGLALWDRKIAQLCRNIHDLEAQGCDVRVICDTDELHRGLPPEISFDVRDSELAIYDDWRFDVFAGGRSGTIERVRIYTPVTDQFEVYHDKVVEYFEAVWSRAQPIFLLLDGISDAIEYSATRIDYQPIWLARYDHDLPEEDKVLKVGEISAVKTELMRLDRWGNVRRFLDVGTCTGRYPISLRAAIRRDGEIFGVDNDLDSVRFARWNVEKLSPPDSRIRILRRDFCAEDCEIEGRFDLITCMLGTLVHFARDRRSDLPYDGPLQRALERFASLLTDDGLLFFSVWSKEESEALRTLSIYSEEDKKRLASWTPPRQEIDERLAAAGLKFLPPLKVEGRMELYCCSRAEQHSAAARQVA